MIARGAREGHDVAADRMLERDARHQVLQVSDRGDALERIRRQPALRGGGREDALLLLLVGVAQTDAEQEPVELRLGQRIRAFQLDRVLRGEHEERLRQLVGFPDHRDVALLHRLQQGGLRLRRGAVDFVREHDVGEQQEGNPPEWVPFCDRFAQSALRLYEDRACG